MNIYLEHNLAEKKLLKIFFLVLLPVLAVIAGMNILFPTPDSEQYEGFFNLITSEHPLGGGPSESHFELGFSLTAAFFNLVLNTNYYTWITFIVGISLLIKFHVFQQFRNGYLVVILYLVSLYTSNECIVVRASIAQSLCMFAFLYIDKSKLKAFLIIVLAILFHNSTSIFLLAIFIPQRIFIKKINIIWFLIALLLLIFLKEAIINIALGIPRFGPYFYDNPKYFNIWGMPRIITAIMSVLILANFLKPEKITQKYFLNISSLLVLFAAVTFDFSLLSIRLLDLALPIILILLLDSLNQKNKFIVLSLLFLMVSELVFTRIIGGPELVLTFLKY